jgi:Ser/Thr protein kinase RdoA (MazF antagonist)
MSAPLPGDLAAAFSIDGRCLDCARHGSGHIHESFAASYDDGRGVVRYLHQRLNTRIFRDPVRLMENVARVTDHLRAKLVADDPARRCLTLRPARDGRPFHVASDGSHWRTFHFIEGTRSFDEVASPEQAGEAARAFGEFAALLADLPRPPLAITIPHFHDLARYLAHFERAVRIDAVGRAQAAAPEIASARGAAARVGAELRACRLDDLPLRIAHNDCKLNNLLFDARGERALCVIDLDTVMPGRLTSDFGSLVRSAATTAAEDERDLARVDFDLERFAALLRGYLEGAGALLTPPERSALAVAGPEQTLENAVRFLADHLTGDEYFRVRREAHNLDRARAQLRLLERMLERLPEVRRLCEAATG